MMKTIIIGAGRGGRLMPLTEDTPKCFAEIKGKRILDWIVDAWSAANVTDIVFIGGYQIQSIREDHSPFRFYHNTDWQNNNILASLFCAGTEINAPFACTYADIIYRPWVTQQLVASPYDITLVVDTAWRERYAARTMHPEDDGEKVLGTGARVTRISRDIDPAAAHGEYIGVAKFSQRGADILREHYHRVCLEYDGMPFQGAASVKKAYLIQIFQEMIEHGVEIHKVDIAGGYYEIDTTQDYEIANEVW
ncbi:MAG: phosphocholine cytidylyltransferase family protein [Candidatus Poribacteria bacterium]|nr:phosphocholine cytidylyltransferase family protein [Candidatus Poribacteria bacterium]